MVLKYCNLSANTLLEWFPELEKEIKNNMHLSENLPSCLYSDVINPVLFDYFNNNNSANEELIKRIFDFFEYLAVNGDEEVRNMLQVSLLENLWDTKCSYENSLSFMKPKTRLINDKIISYLSKP